MTKRISMLMQYECETSCKSTNHWYFVSHNWLTFLFSLFKPESSALAKQDIKLTLATVICTKIKFRFLLSSLSFYSTIPIYKDVKLTSITVGLTVNLPSVGTFSLAFRLQF